jgi:hypothetical protein
MPARLLRSWWTVLPLQKMISVATAGCFLFSFVAAPPAHALIEAGRETRQFNTLLNNFVLPSTLGRVTGLQDFGSGNVVVNIQDLHCHPEVQRNISKVLAFLNKQYGLKKVYVEGGIGELDTSWLCDIKDHNLKHDLVESLVEKGKITGTEYYSALSNRPALLQGIEEEKPYKENLVRLGKIIENRERYAQVCQRLGAEIEVLKGKYLNSDQKRFETLVREYKEGKIKTDKYYRQLKKYQTVHRLANSNNYKNIDTYLEINKDYRSLDYNKISKQLQEFITLLKQKLPYSVYVSLLEKTDNFSRADLLPTYVVQLARQYNLSFDKRYAELSRYAAYLEKSQNINPLELIREEKKLVDDVRAGFVRNADQENISYIADMFGYFEDCLNNRLSPDNYEYFSERFEKFKLLLPRYTGNNIFASLEKDFALLNEYYSVNFKRNNCFMEHIQNDLAQQSTSSYDATREALVVVSGGFHSSGIEKLLAEQHISYITITPNVTQGTEQSESTYVEIARQQAKMFSQNMIAVYMASNIEAEATLLQDRLIRVYLTEKDIVAVRENSRSFAAKALEKVLPGIDKLNIETVRSAMEDVSETWNSQFGEKYGEMPAPMVIENKNGAGFTILFKPFRPADISHVNEPLMVTINLHGKIQLMDESSVVNSSIETTRGNSLMHTGTIEWIKGHWFWGRVLPGIDDKSTWSYRFAAKNIARFKERKEISGLHEDYKKNGIAAASVQEFINKHENAGDKTVRLQLAKGIATILRSMEAAEQQMAKTWLGSLPFTMKLAVDLANVATHGRVNREAVKEGLPVLMSSEERIRNYLDRNKHEEPDSRLIHAIQSAV